MKRLLLLLLKAPFLILLKIRQKNFKGLRYIHYSRGSKTLAIVFSAFDRIDSRRSFNYVKSLSNIPIDFLYLSDPWGYRGSYYMMDKGSSHPYSVVQQLINQIVTNGGGYSNIVTLGTSKGGTAALFYGLKNSVDQIIIGACQYRIGSYVSAYPEIFKGMTGQDINEDGIEEMDSIMSSTLLEANINPITIHLIHSSSEPTYERDIKYLIQDLNERGIKWHEYECGFKKHEEIGQYFIPIARQLLAK